MKKILVVENFNAGKKSARFADKIIEDFFNEKDAVCKIVGIEGVSDENTSEADVIITVGGDGTVNKVVPFAIKYDKPIGVIPCGTANLLSAKLKIPTDIQKALEVIDKGNKLKIDVLKVNDDYSVLRTGFGYDSDIICKTPQSLKNKFGYFSYFVAGVLFALRLKQHVYHLTVDNDKKLSVLATCLIVANAGNMYKNLVSISKNCRLDDGKFDVFILKVKNPILFFIEFLQIIFDKKSSNSKAMYFQTSSISMKNDYCVCHIDGEKQKIRDNIKIETIPCAVNVFCNF